MMDIRPTPKFLTVWDLPNEEFKQYWEQLIGADGIKRHVLAHMQACLTLLFVSWLKLYNASPTNPKFKGRALFKGVPGTGKTITAKGIADRFARVNGIEAYFVQLGSPRSKFEGDSSKNIEIAFDHLRYLAKSRSVILFIDEYDSVAPTRDNEQMHESVKAMVNTLIQEMDNVDSSKIYTIAATNLEKQVDHATKRRFDLIIPFNRPSLSERLEIFEHLLRGWKLSADYMLTIARETERYTQDDITRAVNGGLLIAFENNEPLTVRHVLQAIKNIKPTDGYDEETNTQVLNNAKELFSNNENASQYEKPTANI
jgi:SpoVK/Ycf46/Vps4 family AAA+-type ATPase